MNRRNLVVSDNERILRFFIDLIDEKKLTSDGNSFEFRCAPGNNILSEKKIGAYIVQQLNVKEAYEEIIQNFDLVISAHCKQLFPEEMVKSVKCINIHPGLNPFNRGWYPQVFSIINGKPLGATLHEIDAEIDHGPIIDQEEVLVESFDTSFDAYEKVYEAEKKIVERSIEKILNNTYTTQLPAEEGNLNLKKDFNALCEIDLEESITFQQAFDRLRALTHGDHKNAFFYDEKTKKKVWVSIKFEVEALDNE